MQVPSSCQYQEVPFEKTKKKQASVKFGTAKRPDNFTKKEWKNEWMKINKYIKKIYLVIINLFFIIIIIIIN